MSAQDSAINTTAQDSITGATSGDVNKGLGKPNQGQSSAELHHDGETHRNRQREGLDGLSKTIDPEEENKEMAERLGKKVPGDH